MNHQHHERVSQLFQAVCNLEPESQSTYLDEQCGDDTALREEMERLLDADGRDGSFLDCAILGLRFEISDSDSREAGHHLIGEEIGGFRITRLIGAGGMGVVFEAAQQRPHRDVAIKMLRQDLASASARARFEYEGEILAQLRHPGIAQIYAVGEHRSVSGAVLPYLAMEFVADARPVTRFVEETGLDLRERLELFIDVCEAAHYAHQQGVTHRDLKPGNVLVDADGTVKIIDFGVARTLDPLGRTHDLTVAGQILGTLAYMSPEQLAGDVGHVDTRADVYALGVLLYELLTNRLPFDLAGRPIAEACRIVTDLDPEPLGVEDRALRADLETVVRKAIEKDRERRYSSAAGLAADVRCVLNGDPVSAHPPNAGYLLWKFARRHRALCMASALGLVTLISATVVSAGFAFDANQQRLAAEDASRRAGSMAQALLRVLLEAERDGVGYRVDTRAVERALTDEQLADPTVEASLRLMLAKQLLHPNVFDFVAAESHLLHARTLRERAFGASSDEVVEILNWLGSTYLSSGQVEKAQAIVQEAIACRVQTHGPNHWRSAPDSHLYGNAISSIADPIEHRFERVRLRALRGEMPEIDEIDAVVLAPTGLEFIFEDQFDGGALDPNWIVELRDAVSWEGSVARGTFEVTSIEGRPPKPVGELLGASVEFARPLPGLGDFSISVEIGWDSGDRNDAMCVFQALVVGERGTRIVHGGYTDAWIDWEGEMRAGICASNQARGGADTLAPQGSARIDLVRNRGHVVVEWNGTPILVGECAEPAASIVLVFHHYVGISQGRATTFGSLSVDSVTISGRRLE